ncbi:MAG: hypothetical protein IPQ10_08720 [Saprospiraceae bacterium]|nr:hypothetical protein [Saprospiraceae bacterium]MBK8151791.1 hypothetical protein [Saprospiraceae bacterium]MBK9378138.1 hypothetical protein [Saprospiraceae bacterium]MBL0261131.1 hypothetical protein [Saprospiraceae bacterium]
MTTQKKILTGGLIILMTIFLYFWYAIYTWDSMGECGMDTGPVYGQKINIEINKIIIDEYLTIPGGQFGISNTNNRKLSTDTIPPILVKLDNKRNLIWAVKLDSESSGIPLYEMDNIKLLDDKYGKRITFFNSSYSEPGTIYLTDEFEFDYLCLKAF